jgi:hypothetical protein
MLIYFESLTQYNPITCQPSRSHLITPIAIPGLAEREGNVAVLDHVLDLSPHYFIVSK